MIWTLFYCSPRLAASSPTLLRTLDDSPVPMATPPDPLALFVRTFCAMMSVLRRLAAAAAESPPAAAGASGWGGVCARVAMAGAGAELLSMGEEEVLAMEARV